MTDIYTEHVAQRIKHAISIGETCFESVLAKCEGADPIMVYMLWKDICPNEKKECSSGTSSLVHPTEPFPLFRLPAPDPSRSQWWFSSATNKFLSEKITEIASLERDAKIVCLGAPSLGYYLSQKIENIVVLDVDSDVTKSLKDLPRGGKACQYDVFDALPKELEGSADIVVLDPPWYPELIDLFLSRAFGLLKIGGQALLTFPPRLTRPTVEEERTTLIDNLRSASHNILSLERSVIAYQVPRFEQAALSRKHIHVPSFPWRPGDIIQVQKGCGIFNAKDSARPVPMVSYSRSPNHFRIFLNGRASAPEGVPIQKLDDYSSSISTRTCSNQPDIWTTEKVGVLIGKERLEIVRDAIESWADITKTKQDTINDLSAKYSEPLAKYIVDQLDLLLDLWSVFADPPPLRTEDEINAVKNKCLTKWATHGYERERLDISDSFRSAFQRDRDRVLWSSALRTLSNKTQLFPTEHDDQLRQRLAHSLEVLQLASTIGTSFGLDRDLIEAGSLAHDVGHTPFGHAGEHALNVLFNILCKGLGGFNHYEHGVDVVRWLEGPYYVSNETQFSGLNLTKEVIECIFKHTYCQNDVFLSETSMLNSSKHRDIIKPGFSHLEGQAVRIADKISYFISDIEDGIRLGVLQDSDLLKCQFFHRTPLNFNNEDNESLQHRFACQRRVIVKIIMEDILHATSRRISGASPDKINTAKNYLVNYSDELSSEISEVWRNLQVNRLHKDRRVVVANLNAGRIVTELTLAFSLIPDLIDKKFREEHMRLWGGAYMRHYINAAKTVRIPKELLDFLRPYALIGKGFTLGTDIEIPTTHLIISKDYVAGLTDSRATALHRQILSK